MFFKPLLEETIGEHDLEAIAGYATQGEGAEPGCKTMVNQLPLDVREGCLPYVLGQGGFPGHAIILLQPCSNLRLMKNGNSRACLPSRKRRLSTYFPQRESHCKFSGGETSATYPQRCSVFPCRRVFHNLLNSEG